MESLSGSCQIGQKNIQTGLYDNEFHIFDKAKTVSPSGFFICSMTVFQNSPLMNLPPSSSHRPKLSHLHSERCLHGGRGEEKAGFLHIEE